MNRPYILCNMLTALDGKITGPYMFDEYAKKTMDGFYCPKRCSGILSVYRYEGKAGLACVYTLKLWISRREMKKTNIDFYSNI